MKFFEIFIFNIIFEERSRKPFQNTQEHFLTPFGHDFIAQYVKIMDFGNFDPHFGGTLDTRIPRTLNASKNQS